MGGGFGRCDVSDVTAWVLVPLALYGVAGVCTGVAGSLFAGQSVTRACLLGLVWPFVLMSVLSTIRDDARS